MSAQIDTSWTEWIHSNIKQGCCQQEMKSILINSGFSTKTIDLFPDWTDTTPASKLTVSINDNTRSFKASDVILLPGATRITPPTVDGEVLPIKLYTLDNFVSPEQCQRIMDYIKANSNPSTITTKDEPDRKFRTSRTCHMGNYPDDNLAQLDQRICDYMGIESKRSEDLQGQYYKIGEEFKAHTDFFTPGTDEYNEYGSTQGQRTWTFMIYLNDVPEGSGGNTEFVNLGLSFQPKQGQALIWNNLLPDGSPNQHTLHWAHQVLKGEKYIITKWFRQYGSYDTPFIPCLDKMLLPFTPHGYRVLDFIPGEIQTLASEVHTFISDWLGISVEDLQYQKYSATSLSETDGFFRTSYETGLFSAVLNLDKQEIVTVSVRDLLENWVDLVIKPNQILLYESAKLPIKYSSGKDVLVFTSIPTGWSKISTVLSKAYQSGLARLE